MSRFESLDLVFLDDADCRGCLLDWPCFDRSGVIEDRRRPLIALCTLDRTIDGTFLARFGVYIGFLSNCTDGEKKDNHEQIQRESTGPRCLRSHLRSRATEIHNSEPTSAVQASLGGH